MYSYGVLLCEMCIQKRPNPEERTLQVSAVSDELLKVIIKRCIKKEPEARPTMEQIIDRLDSQ